jgi:hypothetical protein
MLLAHNIVEHDKFMSSFTKTNEELAFVKSVNDASTYVSLFTKASSKDYDSEEMARAWATMSGKDVSYTPEALLNVAVDVKAFETMASVVSLVHTIGSRQAITYCCPMATDPLMNVDEEVRECGDALSSNNYRYNYDLGLAFMAGVVIDRRRGGQFRVNVNDNVIWTREGGVPRDSRKSSELESHSFNIFETEGRLTDYDMFERKIREIALGLLLANPTNGVYIDNEGMVRFAFESSATWRYYTYRVNTISGLNEANAYRMGDVTRGRSRFFHVFNGFFATAISNLVNAALSFFPGMMIVINEGLTADVTTVIPSDFSGKAPELQPPLVTARVEGVPDPFVARALQVCLSLASLATDPRSFDIFAPGEGLEPSVEKERIESIRNAKAGYNPSEMKFSLESLATHRNYVNLKQFNNAGSISDRTVIGSPPRLFLDMENLFRHGLVSPYGAFGVTANGTALANPVPRFLTGEYVSQVSRLYETSEQSLSKGKIVARGLEDVKEINASALITFGAVDRIDSYVKEFEGDQDDTDKIDLATQIRAFLVEYGDIIEDGDGSEDDDDYYGNSGIFNRRFGSPVERKVVNRYSRLWKRAILAIEEMTSRINSQNGFVVDTRIVTRFDRMTVTSMLVNHDSYNDQIRPLNSNSRYDAFQGHKIIVFAGNQIAPYSIRPSYVGKYLIYKLEANENLISALEKGLDSTYGFTESYTSNMTKIKGFRPTLIFTSSLYIKGPESNREESSSDMEVRVTPAVEILEYMCSYRRVKVGKVMDEFVSEFAPVNDADLVPSFRSDKSICQIGEFTDVDSEIDLDSSARDHVMRRFKWVNATLTSPFSVDMFDPTPDEGREGHKGEDSGSSTKIDISVEPVFQFEADVYDAKNLSIIRGQNEYVHNLKFSYKDGRLASIERDISIERRYIESNSDNNNL